MLSCILLLLNGCRLHPVFHCDLVSHSTTATSLRPKQAKVKDDIEEYSINHIEVVKMYTWPRRRGPYLKLFSLYCQFISPEGVLLEQVNDCEELTHFLQCDKWNIFLLRKVYLE